MQKSTFVKGFSKRRCLSSASLLRQSTADRFEPDLVCRRPGRPNALYRSTARRFQPGYQYAGREDWGPAWDI